MKLIFFSFKHRHRIKELNNFLKSRFYGNFFILNLGGPIKHIVARIFIYLKIGKTISCDGRPLIKDKSIGINFWMRGTNLNIPTDIRNLNNNYVPIYNPVIKNTEKIFQIYPVNLIKTAMTDNFKLIYVSKAINNLDNKDYPIWIKYKNLILNDFTILDNPNFWSKEILINDNNKKFQTYMNLKLFLRYEVIKNLKNRFKDKFKLIGSDWKELSIGAEDSIYNINKVKAIYKGNICLDLGSTLGSMSLYPRSNQIIEAGGLLIQSKQNDSDQNWKKLSQKILFKNNIELINLLENLFSNKLYCNNILKDIYLNFIDSDINMEKNLSKIFN